MPDTNIPTLDLASALSPERLAAWLDYELSGHTTATAVLTARFERFCVLTQDGIKDDEMVGHATDFCKVLKDEATATDATRKRIKEPVLHAQRLIDGGAKVLTDKLTAAASMVTARITAFLQQKEANARLAAAMTAAALAHEAEAKLAEAQQASTIEAADAAVEAMEAAEQAAMVANAKPLELTRTRSAGGSLTGLKDNWTYEVQDLSKVPVHMLMINDAAVKLAIKQGSRDIAGLRIWNDAKAFIR